MVQRSPQWNSSQNDHTIPSSAMNQSMSQATGWWSRFTAWFGRQSRPIQVSSGCAGLLVACVMCSCIGTALGAGGGSSTTGTTSTGTGHTSSNPPIAHATGTTVSAMATTTLAATATATATPKPKPVPTNTSVPPPPPKPTCIPGAVNCNPWGYNFTPGNYIYSPPSGFCGYFACINNFWNGRGYVIQCQDGMFSKSGGISGSCSYHRGNKQPLYSH